MVAGGWHPQTDRIGLLQSRPLQRGRRVIMPWIIASEHTARGWHFVCETCTNTN